VPKTLGPQSAFLPVPPKPLQPSFDTLRECFNNVIAEPGCTPSGEAAFCFTALSGTTDLRHAQFEVAPGAGLPVMDESSG
jgi:hypothetical protein